ncbi:hypothetical protein M0D21_22745 [Aquimarina sp. D1M17]|nr:hypothetical protein [Aquimarina acroporae]MCK8524414.1 hypothetical protein [Aquimarina acroporae]
MKNLNRLEVTELRVKEITNISGGCGGEDYTCEELEKIMEALKHLTMML